MGILSKITKKKDEPKAKSESKAEVAVEKEAKPVAKKEKTTKTAKKVDVKLSNNNSVIIRPVISEKSLMQETKGTYTFLVNQDANKLQVKQAVKDIYGVMPSAVRVISVEGKRVRFGVRRGKRSDYKKALVTLPEGKKISIHEGV